MTQEAHTECCLPGRLRARKSCPPTIRSRVTDSMIPCRVLLYRFRAIPKSVPELRESDLAGGTLSKRAGHRRSIAAAANPVTIADRPRCDTAAAAPTKTRTRTTAPNGAAIGRGRILLDNPSTLPMCPGSRPCRPQWHPRPRVSRRRPTKASPRCSPSSHASW